MEFDKETANALVQELFSSEFILRLGRMYGIVVLAKKNTILELMKVSDHPAKDDVLCNVKPVSEEFFKSIFLQPKP